MTDLTKGALFPVLPLCDIVVFPHMIVPLFVGREKSVRALEDVMQEDKQILLLTQKDAAQDDPSPEDLFTVGTIGTILQLLKLPDGTVKVLVEGGERASIAEFTDNDEFFQAFAEILPEEEVDEKESEALARSVVTQFEQYIKLNRKIPPEVLVSINQIEEPSKLADHGGIAPVAQDPREAGVARSRNRPEAAGEDLQLHGRRDRRAAGRKAHPFAREAPDGEDPARVLSQRTAQGDPERNSAKPRTAATNFRNSKRRSRRPNSPRKHARRAGQELKKLRNMSPMSAEATVVRNYLDWMTTIPWKKRSRVKKDINAAHDVLNEDHYGLDKVKERILEYLAVQQRMNKLKGPILCLVGPPGVGKTSLGKSVARATGRKFVRMSLGGVRDEAEVRGHRRTYIGSMPGKVIQGMKKAGTSNPLFLLDENRQAGCGLARRTRRRRCSRCSIRNRTTPSRTITWKWITTCRT